MLIKIMTKQEAIEKAWIDTGIDFEKIKPMLKVNEELAYDFKENGWIDFSPKVKAFEGYNPESLDIIGLRAARPKRLKGIDTNNGWIKIESEADLPKLTIENKDDSYWVINEGVINLPLYLMHKFKEMEERKELKHTFTHYQPIIKPLEPIY